MTYVHVSQYAPTASDTTRHSGCTWSSGASGVAATTGGAKHPTPDAIHALVARSEETSPTTPGWSIPDLALALRRYGIGFVDHSGEGWAAAKLILAKRHYLVVQGVSAVFADSTCSGAFEGAHAIGIHPLTKTEAGVLWRWINDPICPAGRWERDSVLERYAEAYSPTVRFGAFTDPVPPTTYRLRIGANAVVRLASVTPTGRISGWTNDRWGDTASTAPCRAPVVKRGTVSGSATVAYVTAGKYARRWVGIGRGVTVTGS
jgi:hypothetical protein